MVETIQINRSLKVIEMALLRYARLLFAFGALSVLSASGFSQAKPPAEDSEVKMGREASAENDKQVKLITDAKLLERVNRIGQDIAKIANTDEIPAIWGSSTVKQFNYSFKIVDDKDVNAYSLPGGFIYLNKGILDYVKSDDELAGVLAHEVAHASHHHMVKLIKEQNKMQTVATIAAALVALFGRSNLQDVGTTVLAGQLYMVAKLNSYGVEAEKDADQAAVRYLLKTKYNPVGLLTFMERLARDEGRRPEQILGIFRTHPPSPERAKSLLAQLKLLEVEINRRLTDPSNVAQIATVDVNGVKMAEVTVGKTVVARLADGELGKGSERAKKVTNTLDELLDSDLQMYEVKVSPDKTKVIARGRTLVAYIPADAAPQKSTLEGISKSTVEAIRTIIWRIQFDRVPTASSTP